MLWMGGGRSMQRCRQLSRCPKRKQIINVKGFWIPRFGNQLEPVTGYSWWRVIRAVFAKNRDTRLYQWFRRVFGHDDYLHCTQLDILQTRRCTFQRHICIHKVEFSVFCSVGDTKETSQYEKQHRICYVPSFSIFPSRWVHSNP